MKNKLEHIDESKNKWYYLSAIEQSKNMIMSNVVTSEFRDLMKDKLLSCIDICSRDNFDNSLTVNEILDILSDELLSNHLLDKDKSIIYSNLWDNYFLLWDMEKSLESYNQSYNYWNTGILKEIIYMNIFLNLPSKNINEGWNIIFSDIINDLDENKDDLDFWNQIEADLWEFFVGWFDFINNPNCLQDYVYNLELTEIKWISELQSLNFDKEENFIKNKNEIEKILSEQYLKIAEEVNHLEYIYSAFWNMVNRMGWENIDYLEYWRQLKDFLQTWFDMIDTYFEKWEDEKWLELLEFIVVNWFDNLSSINKDFLIDKFEKLIIKHLDKLDDYRVNNVLLKWVNNKIISYDSMLIIWDIFLKIWRYWNAYSFYYFALASDLDLNSKFIELLNTIVFNNNFSDNNDNNDETHPEIILSLLIDKVNNWLKLNKVDLIKIKNICNMI